MSLSDIVLAALITASPGANNAPDFVAVCDRGRVVVLAALPKRANEKSACFRSSSPTVAADAWALIRRTWVRIDASGTSYAFLPSHQLEWISIHETQIERENSSPEAFGEQDYKLVIGTCIGQEGQFYATSPSKYFPELPNDSDRAAMLFDTVPKPRWVGVRPTRLQATKTDLGLYVLLNYVAGNGMATERLSQLAMFRAGGEVLEQVVALPAHVASLKWFAVRSLDRLVAVAPSMQSQNAKGAGRYYLVVLGSALAEPLMCPMDVVADDE